MFECELHSAVFPFAPFSMVRHHFDTGASQSTLFRSHQRLKQSQLVPRLR